MQTKKTKKSPKILCYINHFFGKGNSFIGKSSLPRNLSDKEILSQRDKRIKIINEVIKEYRSIPDIDIKICGINGFNLVDLDISFDQIKSNPVNLIFESLSDMINNLNNYDYFINTEDDIFLSGTTLREIIEFDKESLINELIIPNRLETDNLGNKYCVDLKAIPGWTWHFKKFKNMDIRMAINPHSGILILSKEKLRYALQHINTEFRKHILSTGMESAFAYYHSPFSLFRTTDIERINCIHLDQWFFSDENFTVKNSLSKRFSIYLSELIPPIIFRIGRYARRLLK